MAKKSFLKRFTEKYLLKKAGQAQLAGIVSALLIGAGWLTIDSDSLKLFQENLSVLIGSAAVVIGALAGADANNVRKAVKDEENGS